VDENGEPVNAEDTNHKLNEIEARKIVKEELEPLEKDIDKHNLNIHNKLDNVTNEMHKSLNDT